MAWRPPWWTIARRSTALGFVVLLWLGASTDKRWLVGSTTGTRLLDRIPFVDPLAALETGLAAREIMPSVLLGAGLLILAAALLGPIFCGWICPLGLALDLNDSLRRHARRLIPRLRRKSPRRSGPREVRYLVLGLFVGLALSLRLPVFQILSPINILGWALVHELTWGLPAVGALLVVEWWLPRVWCRMICPLGALYSLAGRFAPLRVRIHPDRAGKSPCRLCTRSCPMGIRVMEDYTLKGRSSIDDPECTRCGSCIDACPRSVVRLGFKDIPPGPPPSPPVSGSLSPGGTPSGDNGLDTPWGRGSLTTTCRPRTSCSASQTMPVPPSPSRPRIRNPPKRCGTVCSLSCPPRSFSNPSWRSESWTLWQGLLVEEATACRLEACTKDRR